MILGFILGFISVFVIHFFVTLIEKIKNKQKRKKQARNGNGNNQPQHFTKAVETDYTKPSAYRKFKIGDVVLYDERGQQYNSWGNFDPTMKTYTRTGIMLIKGFDYDSDLAARCSIGRSAVGLRGVIYGDYAPCGCRYRKAKKHHIKKFIRDICKSETNCRVYAEEIKYLQTLI